ncbi:MAG TPA: hypothetical protein VHT03_01585 [Rhizomicrobium sp.]|jgi:hypothetical protein|nr:hypothetical protein [Rhizomicrobium sp.]
MDGKLSAADLAKVFVHYGSIDEAAARFLAHEKHPGRERLIVLLMATIREDRDGSAIH